MKIGIVAMAPGREPDFTLCDEYYGLAWDEQMRDRCTHLFDPHDDEWYIPNKPSYIDDVNDTGLPIYVNAETRFRHGVKFPTLPKEIDYLESSFAYMIALAILRCPKEIHIWGIRMATTEEYAYQRANCEYLIGYARGRGIHVIIHNSTVCQYSGYFAKYPTRYGSLT